METTMKILVLVICAVRRCEMPYADRARTDAYGGEGRSERFDTLEFDTKPFEPVNYRCSDVPEF